jgi:hypothetical protein
MKDPKTFLAKSAGIQELSCNKHRSVAGQCNDKAARSGPLR